MGGTARNHLNQNVEELDWRVEKQVAKAQSVTFLPSLKIPQKEERSQKRRRTKDTKPPPIWGSVTMSENSGGFFGVSLDIESDLERRILESKKLEQEEEQLRRQYEEQKKQLEDTAKRIEEVKYKSKHLF